MINDISCKDTKSITIFNAKMNLISTYAYNILALDIVVACQGVDPGNYLSSKKMFQKLCIGYKDNQFLFF